MMREEQRLTRSIANHLKMVLQRSKEIQIHGLLLLQEVTDMTQIVSEQSLESQELMLE